MKTKANTGPLKIIGPLILFLLIFACRKEDDVKVHSMVTDIDGYEYKAVKVGDQIWMKENLRVTKLNDGTPINNVTGNEAWASLNGPAYCWYDNNVAHREVYGALYNWHTVKTGKLCPTGWHVPTDAEWMKLEINLGMSQADAQLSGFRGTNQGDKLKETGTQYWGSGNTGASNSIGFSARPAGRRNNNGPFLYQGYETYWWTATDDFVTQAWIRIIQSNVAEISRVALEQEYGFSVRCVKD